MPSETVYGLAAVATEEAALAKVFALKQRPTTDPLIVHLSVVDDPARYATWPEEAQRLADAFWPGPLTLVVPKKTLIPALATAGRPSVALRQPAHPAFQALLQATERPLAAPSANPFGYLSPTEAAHVRGGFPQVPLPIIDGGPCEIGLESTVLDLRKPTQPAVLRPGAVSAEAIADVLDCPVPTCDLPASGESEAQAAPGLLSRHYQPRTPLRLHGSLPVDNPADGFIHLRRPAEPLAEKSNHFWWSEQGDLAEIARQLYRVLHEADAKGFRHLHAVWPVGEHHLIPAIQNRLKRAAE